MQHGTGREYMIDLLENVEAITVQAEVRLAVQKVLYTLKGGAENLNRPGVYGPDYGIDADVPRVTKAERDEAMGISTVLGFEA